MTNIILLFFIFEVAVKWRRQVGRCRTLLASLPRPEVENQLREWMDTIETQSTFVTYYIKVNMTLHLKLSSSRGFACICFIAIKWEMLQDLTPEFQIITLRETKNEKSYITSFSWLQNPCILLYASSPTWLKFTWLKLHDFYTLSAQKRGITWRESSQPMTSRIKCQRSFGCSLVSDKSGAN